MNEAMCGVILDILEVGTEEGWPRIRASLLERGYSAQEIIAAWTVLEEKAGRCGSAPSLDDF